MLAYYSSILTFNRFGLAASHSEFKNLQTLANKAKIINIGIYYGKKEMKQYQENNISVTNGLIITYITEHSMLLRATSIFNNIKYLII